MKNNTNHYLNDIDYELGLREAIKLDYDNNTYEFYKNSSEVLMLKYIMDCGEYMIGTLDRYEGSLLLHEWDNEEEYTLMMLSDLNRLAVKNEWRTKTIENN